MNPAGPGSVPSYPLRTNSSKCNCWVKSHRHSSSNKGTVTQAGSPSPTGLMAKLRVRAGCPRGPEKTSHPAGDRKVCPHPGSPPRHAVQAAGRLHGHSPPSPASGWPSQKPESPGLDAKAPITSERPQLPRPCPGPPLCGQGPRNSEDPA